jgi:OmpA-OmpF porin, OOP family
MRRRRCPWWLPLLLMVPLFFIVAALSKHSIESSLADRARAALAAQGLNDVTVSAHGWGDLRLSGPAAEQAAALAAVEAMGHRHDANGITYAGAGAAAPVESTTSTAASTTTATAATTTTTAATTTAAPTTTTTAASTTTAATTTTAAPAAAVDAIAAVDQKKITLSGYVARDQEKQALVAAANAAYGGGNVVDQLTVKASTPSAAIDGAVGQLGQALTSFGSKIEQGEAHLVDTVLTVKGTAFTQQAASDVNGVLAAAKAAGVTVNGQVTAAPPPDAATLQARLKDLLSRSGINFASGRAEITPAAAAILDTAAQSILQVPGVKIGIAGYTDNVGSAAANQGLSQRRAEAVRAYLVQKGVPAAQLTATGFGPANPIASNDTDEGRATNRRIEFTVGS